MATKNQVKEQFIQSLINVIVAGHSIDINSYRRSVSGDGYLQTSTLSDSNQDIVIYNETYQSDHTFEDTL